MTADTPARQPQHCEHECVCPDYHDKPEPCTYNKDILGEQCSDDTRTHTSPPAPAQEITWDMLREQTDRAYNKGKKDAAKAAREKVLEVFAEVEYLHDVDGITYPDLYNEFIQRYKSLRAQQAGEP